MMPADYTAGPAILPEMPTAGSAKFSEPLPADAAPEDVRHWFDLETIVDLPAPVAGFDAAADAAAQYRRASRSENTRRAYRSAVARFTGWCAVHSRAALPASPETVAAFLAGEARAELAVNTLRLRHAAIRYLHLLAGYPPPTAAATVSTTFAGIKRQHRRPLNKKTALVLDRLLPAIQAIPETLPGLRDRALLLVGFAAALRPSEISGLALEHVARHADGIELFLPWRKNDQDARGTRLWLPTGRTDLCPVEALDCLALSGGDQRGPAVPADLAAAAAAHSEGHKWKAGSRSLPDWYQSDRHRFDRAHCQELDRPRGVRRGRVRRPQPAARGDLEWLAAGVHIARLKQFSGHASLKSLEEYVELDELRHNHPLRDIL
jgi:integrase